MAASQHTVFEVTSNQTSGPSHASFDPEITSLLHTLSARRTISPLTNPFFSIH